MLYIHRQSAYLIGRDRRIADLPVDHPSCSKQHAVFQYRLVPVDLDDGTTVKRIRPYIIDLGSANGTYLNGERIEPQRLDLPGYSFLCVGSVYIMTFGIFYYVSSTKMHKVKFMGVLRNSLEAVSVLRGTQLSFTASVT